MTLRRLFSSLTLLGTLAAPGLAHAAPLVIDGNVANAGACVDGGTAINGGRACEYGGDHTFDSVELKNGAILYVRPYNNSGDKVATGNVVIKSLSSIVIDRSSRVHAKGRGYQRS